MLTSLLKLSNHISIPENFMKKNAPTFYSHLTKLETPIPKLTLEKKQENLSELLEIIKNEMKQFPNEQIISDIKENITLNGINRKFEIKGQIPLNSSSSLNELKDDLFSTLTMTNSFFDIDDNESWKIEETQGKGQKFESPVLYDINGNVCNIKLNKSDCIIFIYDNDDDFNYIVNKIKKVPIIFVCKTQSFFQKKKKLVENGNLNKFSHYFFSENDDNVFNKFKLPRLIILNSKGEVYENKSLNNLKEIDSLEKNLYTKENEDNEKDNLNSFLLNADNKTKLDIIYKINRELEDANFHNVNFEIDNSCKINNKGIFAMKAIAIFKGVAEKKRQKDLQKFIDSTESESSLEKIKNSVTLV